MYFRGICGREIVSVTGDAHRDGWMSKHSTKNGRDNRLCLSSTVVPSEELISNSLSLLFSLFSFFSLFSLST
jgi:hypothetical protein